MNKHHLNNIGRKAFNKELKKQIRFLVIITLGFTIAFTWRQTIFDLSFSFMQFITKIENTTALSVYASIFITVLSIGIIYLASYFLKDKPDDY